MYKEKKGIFTEIQQKFLEYAASPYAGIDGGDENAEYWFVGMEWSSRADFAESYEKWQQQAENPYSKNVDITKGSWVFEEKLQDIYRRLPHTVCDKMIFAEGSNSFKLNLFPLSFNTDDEKKNWANDATAQKTGFANFKAYQQAVVSARQKLFTELLKLNRKEKTIFCFGTGYSEYFATAFDIAESDFAEQTARLSGNRRFYVAAAKNPLIKKIILCPFPRYAFNDKDIEKISTIMIGV